MLTREGCRARLARFRAALGNDWDAAVIHLPEHLLWLANFFPHPNGLNLQSSAFLLIEREGPTTLYIDNWHAVGVGQRPAAETTSADAIEVSDWYTCEGPAKRRAEIVADAVAARLRELRVERLAAETAHLPWSVAAGVPTVRDVLPILRTLREIKDADEIEAIRRGVRTAEAIHAASRGLLRPGISELEYYAELLAHATIAAEGPFVMMCDLASGDRAAQGGGGPTDRKIAAGELVILDLFPYVDGYRGDITNTLVCGGEPTAEQRELCEVVERGLRRAEALLRPGTLARDVHRAVVESFAADRPGAELVHHAGHAIGLGHPEAPELVPHTDQVLAEGMVLTLEPGIYGQATGGIRLEHDYVITKTGFERLSNHRLGLD